MSASELEAAAQRWDTLAAEAIEWGEYDAHMGPASHASAHRAETYKRTAESLRLQIETGEWHCVCCLKPMTFHNGRRS